MKELRAENRLAGSWFPEYEDDPSSKVSTIYERVEARDPSRESRLLRNRLGVAVSSFGHMARLDENGLKGCNMELFPPSLFHNRVLGSPTNSGRKAY
jgi:hypothetical protein